MWRPKSRVEVRTAVDEFLRLHRLSLAALTDEMPGIVWGDGQPTGRVVAYNSFAITRTP